MKGLIPYLNFDGNCREAMEFYTKCLEAELYVMPFSDAPPQAPKEIREANRVMHARLTKGSTVLMASDSMPGKPVQQGDNFWINVNCESLQEIEKLFTAIGEKGKVIMPLGDQFWGARFGMLTDQFGVHWMFNYEHPKK